MAVGSEAQSYCDEEETIDKNMKNTEHKLACCYLVKNTLLSIILSKFLYFEIIHGLVICLSPNIAEY